MHYSLRSLFFSGFLVCSVIDPAIAQLTIDRYVEQVVAANPRKRISDALVLQSEARLGQATAWPDPMLRISFMDAPLNSANVFSAAQDRRITLDQTIPFPGKLGAEADAATAGAESSTSGREDLILTLRMEAKVLFASLQANQEQQSIVTRQIDLLGRMLTSAETRYNVGGSSLADILRMRIELRKLENQADELATMISTVSLAMNELRGSPPHAPLELIEPYLHQPTSLSEDALLAEALNSHPGIAQANAQRTISRAMLDGSEKMYWPDLMLGVGYRNNIPMGKTWEVMLGVSLPIAPWSIGSVSGRVDERRAMVLEMDQRFTERTLELRREVSELYRDMLFRWKTFQRYSKSIMPDALETLGVLQVAYQTNKTDFLSFLDSFRSYDSLSREATAEKMQYLISLARLERAVGRDLTTFGMEHDNQ